MIKISLQTFRQAEHLEVHFHGPLTIQVFQQFNLLRHDINTLQQSNDHDQWPYVWNSSEHSSMKMYKFFKGQETTHLLFTKQWKCASRLKHEVFFWLLLHDKINTGNLLLCKSYHMPSYNCVMCPEEKEKTLMHFDACFLGLPFLPAMLGHYHATQKERYALL